jgi:hypothetical protein
LSDNIPDAIKIAIAEAIMAYATMEGTAERLIWECRHARHCHPAVQRL